MSRHLTGLAIASSLSLLSAVLPTSVVAATAADTDDSVALKYVEFSKDSSLRQVQALDSQLQSVDGELIGYRYENDDIVGEFFITEGDTVESFTSKFKDQFNTEPEFAAAIYLVEDDISQPQENLEVSGNEFKAAPASIPEGADELTEQDAEGKASPQATATRLKWTPERVDAATLRAGDRQHFTLRMAWGENDPRNMPKRFGIEFEINLHNGATGTRPFCGVDAGDKFLAKRQGWYNWYVMLPDGSGIKAAEPYADYNDLSDSCGINSMAVGVRYGTRIPPMPNGKFSLFTGLEAPKGTSNSNRVSGVIQSVDNNACAMLPAPVLTDCMGLGLTSYGSQSFLNYERGWKAEPNLCWLSTDYGRATPRKLAC